MKTTTYPALKRPEQFTITEHTWQDLHRVLPRHQVIRDKDRAPLFSPAELEPGTKRDNDHVVAVHYGVVDLDGIPEEDLVQLLPWDHEFLLFSTYSHRKKGGAWRVVFPYSRPATPDEHRRVWLHLNALVGGKADPKCKGASHAYFVPAVPTQEDLKYAVYDRNEGRLVDLDEDVLRKPVLALAPRAAISPATLTLEGFRKATACQRGPLRSRFGALASGEAFADAGERNNTSFQMMRDLAKVLPDTDPESLRPFLAPSIDDMSPDGGFNLDVVIQQFRTAQEEIRSALDDHESASILRAYGGRRGHAYTQEEIEQFAQDLGISVERMRHLWVLQKSQTYYVFFDGAYRGPFSSHEPAAAGLLAPAVTAGVSRYQPTKQGPKALGWGDLMEHYGTVISKITVDLSRSKSWFDVATGTLYEAPCPPRDIRPMFSPDVDAWCKAFAGEDYHKFQAWLASVPDVSQPTAILFVKGPSGCGKSLLMAGLGRLWLKDPWDAPSELMDSMNAEFNEGLLKCPLAVADESFPATKSAELRRFMQARSHTLRRKYMANAMVIGSPRIIIAANNKNMLRLREVLTADDVRAVGERILYLQPSEEARPLAMAHGHSWVHQDTLAAHVLWLHQNHQYKKGQRFLVEGETGHFHRSLAVSTALSSAICEWVARYLREPQKAAQCSIPVAVDRPDEGLFISPSGLAQYWDLYSTNYKPNPELRDISTALQALTKKTRKVIKVKGKASHFREIDMEYLQQWAEDHDWGDLR